MNISVRRAVAEDVPAISEIFALSWKTAYRGMVPQQYLDELKLDFWNKKFTEPILSQHLYADLVCADGVPVGCVAYGKARDEKYSDWGEIIAIYVRPDQFRKGYGNRLIQSAMNNLKAQGYQNCYLWVLKENSNAQRFYGQNGFVCNQDICHSEIMGQQLTEIRYIRHLD